MKRPIIVMALATLLVACINAPNQPNPLYARDHVYCWHARADGTWVIKGLADTCPPMSRMMVPYSDDLFEVK